MVYDEEDTARFPTGANERLSPRRDSLLFPRPARARSRRPASGRRAWSTLGELAETILLTLVIFLAARALVVNYRVDGGSMQPTLQNGQYLLVNKAVYFHLDRNRLRNLLPGEDTIERDVIYPFHPPARGDIVVLIPPDVSDKPFVKRVIGVPGDTVAVRGGQILVNGEPLEEPYIADPARYTYPPDGGAVTVPPGTVFVLGDNRNNSRDSHAFGPVTYDAIVGKAIVTYWPRERIGLIGHGRYDGVGRE